jgi:hypothetical protein
MSADIEKMAVFDSRIVQSRPRYAVEKGALSLTNAPFNAISATSSQHTYNIYVPSENVFVDRGVEWTSTAFLTSTLTISTDVTSGPIPVGTPLVVPAVDFSLCAFPLNSLCSTLTATINDTTSVINSQDVLKEVLRLTDYKKNRLQRNCPTMLDKYQCYDDAYGLPNSPLGGYGTAMDYDGVQNGAFGQIVFTDVNGTTVPEGQWVLANGTATAVQPSSGTGIYRIVNGLPCLAGLSGSATVPIVGPYQLYYSFTSTEKIVLSPFTFSDVHEWDTGLFGINNIQLIMNLQSPARAVRYTGMRWGTNTASASSGATLTGTSFQNTPFGRSLLNVQFLTPSLDVPLPPKSVVPYMEFPRYITQAQPIRAKSAGTIQSQTITLPQIPDLLIVYAKNPALTGTNFADSYMPIASRAWGGISNPLSVNFDNFSGLLSSHTAEELYGMSVHNGLDQDWLSWSGFGFAGQNAVKNAPLNTNGSFGGLVAGGNPPSAPAGQSVTSLVGSLLVLKPSQDITLQTGQAPSLVGNFTLQMNIQYYNSSDADVSPVLYVITANSGFFESIRGSSRIIKGVLSEQDIIGAPLAPTATRQELQRYVGGGGLMSSLGTILSKVKGPALDLLKQVGKEAGQQLLHHGKEYVKGKLGIGGAMSGGESGGAMSGGMSGGRRKLDARMC